MHYFRVLLGISVNNCYCLSPGKGPLKKHYENIIASLHLEHVLILQVWLSAEDYPLLLGKPCSTTVFRLSHLN